jgi:hypothetical protein
MMRRQFTKIDGVSLDSLRTVWLPYCLHRRDDGAYVLLNRHYHPIGWPERGNVDEYPYAFRFANMTPKLASRLSCVKSPDMDMIHLYTEAYAPCKTVKLMAKYLARLVTLAKQKVAFY